MKGLKTGVISSVKSFRGNPHDSKTLSASLEQSQRVREKAGGNRPQTAIADRGYRGVKQVEQTQIVIPDSGQGKSKYEKEKARKRPSGIRCHIRSTIVKRSKWFTLTTTTSTWWAIPSPTRRPTCKQVLSEPRNEKPAHRGWLFCCYSDAVIT